LIAARIRQRTLQTPVIRYANGTGRSVTVVALTHVGEARYYEAISELAAGLESEGATVQYENPRHATAEELAAATEEERAAVASIDRSNPKLRQLARYLGWEPQQDALSYPPSWQHSDLSDLEIVQLIGTEFIHTGQSADGGKEETDVGAQWALLIWVSGRRITSILERLPAPGGRDWRHIERHVDDVLVRLRNEKAIAGLPASGDAVLLWGTDHAAGIGALLTSVGYTRAETRWLDVGTLPPLRAIIRDIRRTRR
jgi:hypothetical protein